MSVSGKKEFDVKQILRLRWRWFSHPSQSSTGTGGCLQQEGYEHRGTPVQNRLKSHSRDRNGLKKNNSPIHHNILAPVPSPTPVHHRPIQTWHEQSLIEHLQATEHTPEAGTEENCEKNQSYKHTQDPQMITEDHNDESVERWVFQMVGSKEIYIYLYCLLGCWLKLFFKQIPNKSSPLVLSLLLEL